MRVYRGLLAGCSGKRGQFACSEGKIEEREEEDCLMLKLRLCCLEFNVVCCP